MHVKRAVTGNHHRAPPPPERHAHRGSEAITHAAHAERDEEAAAAAHRQIVDRGRTGVARIDDDVHAVGQRGVEGDERVTVAHTGTVEPRRGQLGMRH